MRTATQAARQPARQVPIWNGNGNAITDSIELMGARMSYARNVEIYGQGEPAEYLYKVMSGAVRISKLLDDGRRQVTAFHLPGEIFGLELGKEHRFSAEAISESSILVVKRSTVLALAGRDGEVARQLWTLTADALLSRTMTQLENDATIRLPTSRRIVLRNLAALGRLNS